MAFKCLCDGCGAAIDDPDDAATVGAVLRRQYCSDCTPKVTAYLKALDDLHTKSAAAFQKKRASLRKPYIKEGFSLPDVPEE